MSLLPNIKSIFKENLGLINKQPVVEVAPIDTNKEIELGAKHEKEEHGLTDVMAHQMSLDHIKEHPGYYSKLAAAGLDEELSTDPAPAGTPNAPPTPNAPNAQAQGKDPSQMDPNVYKKYKAEADGMDKKIEQATQNLQKLRQDKAGLAKKYGVNPAP